jgi:hypothetical protein
MQADDFAENILGFEEVEEVEGDEGDEMGAATGGLNGTGAGMMGSGYGGMGVIPEEAH